LISPRSKPIKAEFGLKAPPAYQAPFVSRFPKTELKPVTGQASSSVPLCGSIVLTKHLFCFKFIKCIENNFVHLLSNFIMILITTMEIEKWRKI